MARRRNIPASLFDRMTARPGSSVAAPADGAPAAEARPLTVSQLNARVKAMIESGVGEVLVEGETSNVRPAPSGHVYFRLKDAGATVNCVMWATSAARLAAPLRDGDQVEVRAAATLYEPQGQYQLVVSSVRPAGLGRLHAAFLALKERLASEGLFDPARKVAIPRLPKRVGIVTSPTGAAVRDIIHVLGRRAPQIEVIVYPVRVQGEGAAAEIAKAVRRMDSMKLVDVLIVGRGGGSIEDLWAFNEEIVARAIADCQLPVISAVGHEIDFTIADFVADLRAPTPSAAAEVVAAHAGELRRELVHLQSRIQMALDRQMEFLREAPHLSARLASAMRDRVAPLRETRFLAARLQPALLSRIRALRDQAQRFRPEYAAALLVRRVNDARQRLDTVGERSRLAVTNQCAAVRSHAERLAAQLTALNPSAVLARGYSVVVDAGSGKIITRRTAATPGRAVRVRFADGEAPAHFDREAQGAAPPPPRPDDLFGNMD